MNLPEYQSQKSLANYRQSVISIPKSMRGDPKDMDVEKSAQRECIFSFFIKRKTIASTFFFQLCRTTVPVLGAARVIQGGSCNDDGHVTLEKSNLPSNWHKQRFRNGRSLRSICLSRGCSKIGRHWRALGFVSIVNHWNNKHHWPRGLRIRCRFSTSRFPLTQQYMLNYIDTCRFSNAVLPHLHRLHRHECILWHRHLWVYVLYYPHLSSDLKRTVWIYNYFWFVFQPATSPSLQLSSWTCSGWTSWPMPLACWYCSEEQRQLSARPWQVPFTTQPVATAYPFLWLDFSSLWAQSLASWPLQWNAAPRHRYISLYFYCFQLYILWRKRIWHFPKNFLQTQPVILDQLTPIDEDIEEEESDGEIPEIVETAPSPLQEMPEKEIKQIESVL